MYLKIKKTNHCYNNLLPEFNCVAYFGGVAETCGTEDKADFGGEESGAAEAKFGGADAIGF